MSYSYLTCKANQNFSYDYNAVLHVFCFTQLWTGVFFADDGKCKCMSMGEEERSDSKPVYYQHENRAFVFTVSMRCAGH